MRTREHVMPGMPIESADGTTIGTVKEVAGGYFKVDAPLHRDYWLPSDLVAAHTATALQLGVDCSAAAGRRVPAPRLAMAPMTGRKRPWGNRCRR